MINIKGKKDYIVALESVAMTDIVMTIFIFFFISFSLLYTFNPERVSKITVKLPRASSAVALEGPQKATITITREGEYFVNDKKVRRADLKKALQRKVKEDPDLNIILKVDSMTRFTSVVSALDVINELNVRKISITAIKKD